MYWKWIPLLFLFVSLIGCGSGKGKGGDKNTGNNGWPGKEMGDSQAVPVEITPVVRGNIASYLLYNSTLETEEMADIYSRIPGIVEEIFVEEGDWVKKDQPLLKIEQAEYLLSEEKARLQYEKQKSEFNRFKSLREKNLISVEEFENARISLQQAELEWKQARLNLDYTLVKSPINGVVGERQVKVGDRIQTSQKLMIVSNLKEKIARLYIPQDEMPRCYLNQKAEITSEVIPGKTFIGIVKRISPIVDPISGTFSATISVEDPQNQLAPGMFVKVRLIVDTHQNVPLLPKTALIYENERAYFYVVKGDSVEKTELKKGFEDAARVELLNAIPDSAKIVVVGQNGLKDGSKINIVNMRLYDWQKAINPALEKIALKEKKSANRNERPAKRVKEQE
ncbi:MAG: efflux RND transporter periplasmic adaptor subunit [Calditrichia bacterium]